jgi:hypothetical protein
MKTAVLFLILVFATSSVFCQASDNKEKTKTTTSTAVTPKKTPKRVLNLPVVYTFIGNGDWDDVNNWDENGVPPPDITPGSEIHINSLIAGGKCILNVPYEIPNTTNTIKLIVYTGNELVVPDLIVK